MKQPRLLGHIFYLLILSAVFIAQSMADDGYELWMKYKKVVDEKRLVEYQRHISSILLTDTSETCRIVREELENGLGGLLGRKIPFISSLHGQNVLVVGTPKRSSIVKMLCDAKSIGSLGKEGFVLKTAVTEGNRVIVLAANENIGLLYGAFHLLRLIQTLQPLDSLDITSRPRTEYRLLDHWDNLDGSIERGYAGKSLWKWDELPNTLDPRYRDYARAASSIGINGTVLNNVNADPRIIDEDHLLKIKALADLFRPYGIRVFLSVNFASPMAGKFELEGNRAGGIGKLKTADPLDPEVRLWWKNKVKEIYSIIPDFGGFLVKANSEGMPGPQDFGRTHVDGANMLAEALQPYGGIVMWRAFVYNADVDADRVKRAYKEFVPFDGKFLPNVFVQAKNGPLDFQPREPVQALFGAMPRTPLMLELQITQEYLGHSTHLVYLAPMWKEYLQFDLYAKGPGSTLASIVDGTLQHYQMTGMAGVANIGDDRNWCGHLFAQANWYAFGRLAWDHDLSAEQIANEWIRMTLSNDSNVVASVRSMMMGSREACVDYMEPLGLHHIMQTDFHYGPEPSYDKRRLDWTPVYYHRADSIGIGFDRSSTGSNAAGQYFSPLKEMFDDTAACPEKYLLWFHHVRWNHKMKSGRTLWEELCNKYYAGTAYVDSMLATWNDLQQSIDPEMFRHVKARLEKQKVDAAIWRDTCLKYFQQFSKRPILRSP
ncbi:MAG TPA: alpha-glucuronidase family glycosyl hydrolase [Bacteroidota bacterium]|nr:alpha-glucuronidase family glycosyl hydrolase [Bacteroidota bacterium]